MRLSKSFQIFLTAVNSYQSSGFVARNISQCFVWGAVPRFFVSSPCLFSCITGYHACFLLWRFQCNSHFAPAIVISEMTLSWVPIQHRFVGLSTCPNNPGLPLSCILPSFRHLQSFCTWPWSPNNLIFGSCLYGMKSWIPALLFNIPLHS